MFVKFGALWLNPAHIETIAVPENADAMVSVHTVSGDTCYSTRGECRELLNMLGIATDKATIIHNLIADFVADWPGLEYGVGRLIFGQGNLTDTVIQQVRRDITARLTANGLDSSEREELRAVGHFLELLLKHTEADRIAAMDKAQQNRNGAHQ